MGCTCFSTRDKKTPQNKTINKTKFLGKSYNPTSALKKQIEIDINILQMSYNTVVKDLETDNIIDKKDSNNDRKNISNKNLMDQTVKLKPKENDDIEKTKTDSL